jgi:thiamine kinase-like enzyme
MTDVIDALVKRLWPERHVTVQPLLGGITNANYFVDLGDEQVVVRIPGDHTALLGIDRRHETAANHLAASIGVAPEVLDRSESEGWMVTRFLPGRPIDPTELAIDPMLGDLAATLRRLHRAGTIEMNFNPFAIVRQYHEVARTRDVVEPFDFPAALETLGRIEEVHAFRPTCFCHNDLLNANFIYDGSIRILDWEYAGMGDPFFDLANFSVNHELSPTSDERLLTHYFGHCDASLMAVLALMKLVSELREAMWGVVQMAVSTLDVDFAAYARERSSHYESLVHEMDLARTVKEATRTNVDEGLEERNN